MKFRSKPCLAGGYNFHSFIIFTKVRNSEIRKTHSYQTFLGPLALLLNFIHRIFAALIRSFSDNFFFFTGCLPLFFKISSGINFWISSLRAWVAFDVCCKVAVANFCSCFRTGHECCSGSRCCKQNIRRHLSHLILNGICKESLILFFERLRE